MYEKIFAGFYLEKLYFMPHFEPVIEELQKRGLSYRVIIPANLKRDEIDQHKESIEYCQTKNLDYCPVDECPSLNFMIFANSPCFLPVSYEKTAIIFHGTWGGKAVYLAPSLNNVDIRFIDGKFYEDILGEYYPEEKSRLCLTGYSKLDAYFKYTPEDRKKLLEACHLDVNKKTLLYAPTFYPSSTLKIKSDFPGVFKDYNIIIKPHANVFLRSRYRSALKHIRKWGKYDNVYVADFKDTNILPFMYASDVMLSDISSAVYEFAGLGKPVVVNMFLHYRWYHLLLKNKIEKRLDKAHFYLWEVGNVVNTYKEMVAACQENLHHPELYKEKREKWVKYVLGDVDGKVSVRIADKLQAAMSEE